MKLVTQKTLEYVKLGLSTNVWLKCHPYERTREGNFIVGSKWYQRCIWYTHVTILTFYTAFVHARCAQALYDPGTATFVRLHMLFMCIYYAFFLCLQVNTCLNLRRIPVVAQGYFNLLDKTEGDLANQTQIDNKLQGPLVKEAELYCKVSYHVFMTDAVFLAVFSFLRPESPEMISSVLVSNPEDLTFLQRIVCTAFQAYWYFGFAVKGHLDLTCFIILVSSSANLLSILNKLHSSKPLKMTLSMYREFYMVVGHYCGTYMISYSVAHAMLTLIGLFSVYAAIRLPGFISLGFTIFAGSSCIFVIGMITFLAEVNQQSRRLLQANKVTGGSGIVQRLHKMELRSLRELQIWFGGSFYYDKMLVLTTLKLLLEHSITLLLIK